MADIRRGVFSLCKDYKKDIISNFLYEFELSHK